MIFGMFYYFVDNYKIMQLRNLFFLIFLCQGTTSFCQAYIDSLHNLLVRSEGVEKVEVLLSLINAYVNENPQKALEYVIQGEKLANEIGNMEMRAKMKNAKGRVHYYLNELNLSDESYFEALNLFDSAGIDIEKARVLSNIAWNYKVRNMYAEALEYYTQSLALARKSDDPMILQMILNNLGTVYRNQELYKDALAAYDESLRINRSIGNERWEAYNLNNIGMALMDSGQYELAGRYIHMARKLNLKNDFLQEYCLNLLNLGALYNLLQKYDSADYYLDLAGPVIEVHGFKRERLDYYGRKRDLFESQRNFRKALEFEKLYNGLNSELNLMEWNEKVTALQTKYEIAQKDRALEASERKLTQQRFVILAVTASAMFLLILLFLVMRMYKDRNQWVQNIERLNEEIRNKNIELESMNERIRKINNDLEQTVKNRTEKILDQNEKLIRYAFINSHEVRGPLARVLGLLYLIGLENGNLKNEDTFRLLKESTDELDCIIKKASKLLEKEDYFREDQTFS